MRSCCSVHLGERTGLNREFATAPKDPASFTLRLLPSSFAVMTVDPESAEAAIGSVVVTLPATAGVRPAIQRCWVGPW